MRVVQPSNESSTDVGMELNLGVRQWLGPQLEVGGKVGYVSIDNDDDWTGSATLDSTQQSFSLWVLKHVSTIFTVIR